MHVCVCVYVCHLSAAASRVWKSLCRPRSRVLDNISMHMYIYIYIYRYAFAYFRIYGVGLVLLYVYVYVYINMCPCLWWWMRLCRRRWRVNPRDIFTHQVIFTHEGHIQLCVSSLFLSCVLCACDLCFVHTPGQHGNSGVNPSPRYVYEQAPVCLFNKYLLDASRRQ